MAYIAAFLPVLLYGYAAADGALYLKSYFNTIEPGQASSSGCVVATKHYFVLKKLIAYRSAILKNVL